MIARLSLLIFPLYSLGYPLPFLRPRNHNSPASS
jgi:hypothetical protein